MTEAHLPIEELAAYAAGELDALAAVAVEVHVVLCQECRSDIEGLRRTAAALAAVPAVTMPPEVAARLDEALAAAADDEGAAGAESAGPVAPVRDILPARRSRPPLAGFAAAAAVLALFAAVGIGVIVKQHDRSKASTAAGVSGASHRVFTSGFDYTRANIAGQVPGLLQGSLPPGATEFRAGAESPARVADSQANSTSGKSTTPRLGLPPLDALRQGPALAECLTALLAGGPDVAPLLLDYASWQGSPALVVVFPRMIGASPAPDQVDVWVVGPGCGAANAQVLDFQRVQVTPR